MVLGPTTILPRMTGLYTIDTQYAVSFASLHNRNSRKGANAVVIKKPLDIDG